MPAAALPRRPRVRLTLDPRRAPPLRGLRRPRDRRRRRPHRLGAGRPRHHPQAGLRNRRPPRHWRPRPGRRGDPPLDVPLACLYPHKRLPESQEPPLHRLRSRRLQEGARRGSRPPARPRAGLTRASACPGHPWPCFRLLESDLLGHRRLREMITSLLRALILYCALTDLMQVADKAGQMQNLHQQLARAAREL